MGPEAADLKLTSEGFKDGIMEWLKEKGGRELDAVGRSDVEALAEKVEWSDKSLTLETKSRSEPKVTLTAEVGRSSLRVARGDAEVFSFEASGEFDGTTWKRLKIGAAADAAVLEDLKNLIAPGAEEVDLLDLFLALPWVTLDSKLLTQVRTALREDLLVDLCDAEDDDDEDDSDDDEPQSLPKKARRGDGASSSSDR